MGKHYTDEAGTLVRVDCKCGITGAVQTKLKVKRPDGVEVEWPATISGTDFLEYTTQTGDLALPGAYFLQSSLVLGGWAGKGETAVFTIYARYK